jgi:hypothetical protein
MTGDAVFVEVMSAAWGQVALRALLTSQERSGISTVRTGLCGGPAICEDGRVLPAPIEIGRSGPIDCYLRGLPERASEEVERGWEGVARRGPDRRLHLAEDSFMLAVQRHPGSVRLGAGRGLARGR